MLGAHAFGRAGAVNRKRSKTKCAFAYFETGKKEDVTRTLAMALPGFRCLGQVLVQFMMVWQLAGKGREGESLRESYIYWMF